MRRYLAQETSRISHWFPVAISVGILSYFALDTEPTFSLTISLFLITFLFWLVIRKYYSNLFILCLPYVWLACFGFLWTQVTIHNLVVIMLKHPLKSLEIKGQILDICDPIIRNNTKKQLIIKIDETQPLPFRGLVRLTLLSDNNSLNPGDHIKGQVDLYPILYPPSPLSFDFRRYNFLQKIAASGRIDNIEVIKNDETHLNTYRYQLTLKFYQLLEHPYGAIAAALVTGDRSNISKEIRQNFVDSGIAHVLAISGLHLGLIAGIVFFLLRFCLALIPPITNRFLTKKLACIFTIPITFLYLAISGFGIPAQRAFIMTSIAMAGIFFDRSPLSMRSIVVAALVILVIIPQSLLSASFQLSFAAVVALIAFYEKFSSFYYRKRTEAAPTSKYLKTLWYLGCGVLSVTLTTLVATLATTPFTIALFQRFTLQGILGNVLVIPLVSFWIMPCALLAVSSLIFGGFDCCFWLWKQGIALMVKIAIWVSSLPGAAITVPTPHPLFILLITFGGLWLCLWHKAWRWWGIVPMVIGTLFYFGIIIPTFIYQIVI